MISGENLRWNFERNASYVHTLLADLDHADSLLQPPVNGNCINWILGHIVCYRNYTMTVCALEAVVTAEVADRYARDSAPVTGAGTDVADFAQLVAAYTHSHAQLLAYLQTVDEVTLSEVVSAAGFTLPRGELLTSFMRHESYHAGQFELLRSWVLAQRAERAV
jgi:uncharacterized damage-inducible protein DinB